MPCGGSSGIVAEPCLNLNFWLAHICLREACPRDPSGNGRRFVAERGDAMQDVAAAERADEWVPATSAGMTSVGGATFRTSAKRVDIEQEHK